MIVAMTTVWVMQMIANQIVHVIPVRNRLV